MYDIGDHHTDEEERQSSRALGRERPGSVDRIPGLGFDPFPYPLDWLAASEDPVDPEEPASSPSSYYVDCASCGTSLDALSVLAVR
jgi:hypothetical protein